MSLYDGIRFFIMKNEIINGDCIDVMKTLPENYFSACITDPPYNYEFIGHKWNDAEIKRRTERIQNSNTLVKHIPYGSGLSGGVRNRKWYQRNRDNILDYQNWCFNWATELFRVCKPGATVLVFNSTRTVAHVQVALESAGFYARDIVVYRRNSGIPKGINMEKKLEKKGFHNPKAFDGWHSCLRSEWEAICVLQKPLKNNYLETAMEYGTGLFYTKTENNGFQSNIIENIKKDPPQEFNVHCTVKPLHLMSKLIEIFVPKSEGTIILDPFSGSGTTLVASKMAGIDYVGIEIEPSYIDIIEKRLQQVI